MIRYRPNQVGKGWNKLITKAVDQLNIYFENKDISLYIKEKFGSLRINLGVLCSADAYKIMDDIEIESMSVCEVCGRVGQIRNDLSWIKTLCKKHYEEKKEHERRLYG